MSLPRKVAVAVPILGAGVAAFAFASYRGAMEEAERGWDKVAAGAKSSDELFDPASVEDLPEIARRYFNHAIAAGAPLASVVELRMQGTFLVGEKGSQQVYDMKARQILRPPTSFVWIPQMKSGLMRISGSDALVDGVGWSRFWLLGLVPVANVRGGTDLARSAAFRSAMESIWVPSSLLPANGVVWEQTGPDGARVRLQRLDPEIVLDLTLASDGAVRKIVGQRWSNANPEGVFKLQPFGGSVTAERRFGGYTIPSGVEVGNHFGTDDYLPFFRAEIVSATFH
ncbi:MAG TPA: DUF6544 family protein [Allosphingosinicella sp.]|jgi:hypothetical protein